MKNEVSQWGTSFQIVSRNVGIRTSLRGPQARGNDVLYVSWLRYFYTFP